MSAVTPAELALLPTTDTPTELIIIALVTPCAGIIIDAPDKAKPDDTANS